MVYADWRKDVEKGIPESMAKIRRAAQYYKEKGVTVKRAYANDASAFEDDDVTNLDCDKVLNVLNMPSWPNDDEEKVEGASFDMDYDFVPNEDGTVLVVGTKDGAQAKFLHADKKATWTDEVLKNMTHTWTGGTVGRNHMTFNEGKILLAEYKDGKAFFLTKPDAVLAGNLDKCVGVSVEAFVKTDAETGLVTKARGSGITFVFDPATPVCTPEEGCGVAGAESGDDIMSDEIEQVKEELEKVQAALVDAKTGFEEALAGKDTTIKELETANAALVEFQKSAIADERTVLVDSLKEFGMATDTLDEVDNSALKLMVQAAEVAKTKFEADAVTDSGVEGTAEEKVQAAEEVELQRLVREKCGLDPLKEKE